MGIIKEFKEFAVKGNLVDMAVGIIMGAAFGKIVSSLVSDIIMPPLGMVMGQVDFKDLKILLKPGHPAVPPLRDAAGNVTSPGVTEIPEVAIKYGQFLNTILDFLIVAIAIFLVIKQINRFRELASSKEKAAPTTKECPFCCATIPVKATRCPQCTSDLK